MRMGKLCLLLIIGLLAGFTQTGSAIECFSCESATDKTCGDDNFTNTNKVDCSKLTPPQTLTNVINSAFGTKLANGCLKVTLASTDGEENKKFITRTCFWGDIKNPRSTCEHNGKLVNNADVQCDVCTDELCNGAESITFGITAFIVAFTGRLLI
ncbi:uncharacterized protein LOC129608310 isoform X4 [Condylostylus longicornis]|uniref:uncharacterized protein LOC129608310 isoform X4 n=1 Tax=Condylostylus longicornis TaxID=2530218 RepID=UPI00244E3CF0|nr:uncharacterized protein LOC129608310 isoform X4 [Condylostylus longicornis]XP_055375730.1 uncharacterized protein LOC129608310 isoform X4 [Condylostylus longicornis]